MADYTFTDEFDGNDEHLLGCIDALLELDAEKALVPHGLGGHGRALLSAAASRLQSILQMQALNASCIVP